MYTQQKETIVEDILVPLGFFAVIPVTVGLVSFNRRKTRAAMADVMKSMVERGEPLTPEIIGALGVRPSSPYRDLRFGLVLIAVGIATLILGGLIPEDEATVAFAGVATFPLLIGAVYVALWAFIGRKQEQGQ